MLAAIGGVLSLFLGVAMMGAAGTATAPAWLGLFGIASVLLALLNVPMIYGLWTVKGWGWTLAMVIYAINVGLDLLNLVTGDGSAILSLLVSVLILAYIASKAHVYGK